MTIYHVWTDGSKGEHGDAGVGVVIVNRDLDGIEYLFGEYIGKQTSNYAEFYAVQRALETIYERVTSPTRLEIEIRSDSQLLVKGMNGENKINRDGKSPHLEKVKIEIEKLHFKLKVEPEYIWVKAHVGNRLNELADFLAVKAMAG
jgi:ribonuclease HI